MGGKTTPRTPEEMALVPAWVDALLGTCTGVFSASCAAPLIMTVDKAVTENSAGKSRLSEALARELKQVFTRPHVMLSRLPFWMVAGVYGSTYATANMIDVACERGLDRGAERTPVVAAAVKLFGVTAVNMVSGVAKDAAFARMFGAGGAKPPPVPRVSLGLFAFRDVMTISAAFTLPPLLAQSFVASGSMDEQRAAEVAQLASPIGMQCVLTPIHLLALNMYNSPGISAAERASALGKVLAGSTLARMGRFGAAYGVGGLMNTSLTKSAREWAAGAYGAPAPGALGAGASTGLAAAVRASPPVLVRRPTAGVAGLTAGETALPIAAKRG